MTLEQQEAAAQAIVANAIEEAGGRGLSMQVLALEFAVAINHLCHGLDREDARAFLLSNIAAEYAMRARARGNA